MPLSPSDFNPVPVLPLQFETTVEQIDMHEAICGSVTNCTNARSIARALHDQGFVAPHEEPPHDFYIKVKENHMMVRVRGVYHRFNMPDEALRIVAANDSGQYELVRPKTKIVYSLERTRPQNVWLWRNPHRRAQVNKARQERAKKGNPDRGDYLSNTRILAAIKEGVHRKKLMPKRAIEMAKEVRASTP